MQNRWNNADAQSAIKKYTEFSEDIALRVYTSRLIGSEPALVLHGGGNTSVKSTAKLKSGEQVHVLYVKGSGWDLDTLEPAGLPGVRLDPLLKLRALDRLSDEDMVNEQRTNMLDASGPNPSVETLLHAYLPHKFIDHSHADAILAIANQPDSVAICKKIYGDTFAVVPYIMPGFALAKSAAEIYEKNPKVQGMVLINHGLFTFADTAKDSYERHIDAVTRAEEYIARSAEKPLTPLKPLSVPGKEILRAVAPVLRGLFREQSGVAWMVHHRQSETTLNFASSKECAVWSQIGTITPDHVIRTKQKPLLLNLQQLNDPARLRDEIATALDAYIENYHRYFKTCMAARKAEKKELDPLPRVVLVAGLGLLTLGRSLKDARIAADVYEHTVQTIRDAFRIGTFAPLGDADLFDMEYWSLEQAKLGKGTAPKLQGKVAYITGAASGIGLATARLFAQHGAGLYLTDIDSAGLDAAVAGIKKDFKAAVTGQQLDVTDECAVRDSIGWAVECFGGLDIAVSNAGNAVQGRIGEVELSALRQSFELNFFAHHFVATHAVRVFLRQKNGGALLFNASKAAFNPGKDFGPYALPKAAVVALMKQFALDYGSDGVRANAINADRIRTGLFTDDFVEERSKARGLKPEDYFKENLLRREVYASDVAEGFLHLALAEKTTGSVLTVDGGNIAASPR